MKKLLYIFLLFSISCFSAASPPPFKEENIIKNYNMPWIKSKDNEKKLDDKKCCDKDKYFTLALKAGYFWPQEKMIRKNYNDGFIPLIEGNYTFYKGLGIFLETGFFYQSGHVNNFGSTSKTKIYQAPTSYGLSYVQKCSSFFDLYFKFGPNWIWTKTWIDLPPLKKVVTNNSFGITVGTAGRFYLTKNLFLELFANYLYNKKSIHDRDSLTYFSRFLGGIQTGAGLGWKF